MGYTKLVEYGCPCCKESRTISKLKGIFFSQDPSHYRCPHCNARFKADYQFTPDGTKMLVLALHENPLFDKKLDELYRRVDKQEYWGEAVKLLAELKSTHSEFLGTYVLGETKIDEEPEPDSEQN